MLNKCPQALRTLEHSVEGLEALLSSGSLSPIAQMQGEKTAREIRSMLNEATAREGGCSCGHCDDFDIGEILRNY